MESEPTSRGVSVVLGGALQAQIVEGLRRHAGPADGGLINEGLVMGLGYT